MRSKTADRRPLPRQHRLIRLLQDCRVAARGGTVATDLSIAVDGFGTHDGRSGTRLSRAKTERLAADKGGVRDGREERRVASSASSKGSDARRHGRMRRVGP